MKTLIHASSNFGDPSITINGSGSFDTAQLGPRPDPLTGKRDLSAIVREIRHNWKKPNYAAVPYLDAMSSLDSVRDNYGADSGKSVVLYFLANAGTWKGEVAKRIKAELKALVK